MPERDLYVLARELSKQFTKSKYKSFSRGNYYGNQKFDDYPVLYVSWNNAKAYCEWVGSHLPTEAEWEKAARGNDRRVYPWGDAWDVLTVLRLNFSDKNDPTGAVDSFANDGYADTAPVGNYPNGASPYGVLDMAGNIWEWVSDWYGENFYSNSPSSDPIGPDSGTFRVFRGGSFLTHSSLNIRSANRLMDDPKITNYDLGFRCSRSE